MRPKELILSLALPALALAGCGDGESTSTATATADCSEVPAPEPKQVKLERPDLKPPPAGTQVVFETNCGPFTVALDTENAPRTSASFAHLVEEGVYDDTAIHRVAPGFVIQGGDPAGDGTGGAGYTVDEKPPPNLAYTKGIVAMAKSSADPPGRSSSQFYVVTGADAGLPPEYALVGKVSEGMDVVERIGSVPVNGEEPKQPVLIEKVTLEKG